MDGRGKDILMVDYTFDHPSGTYMFYNPYTDSIVISDSVSWGNFKP